MYANGLCLCRCLTDSSCKITRSFDNKYFQNWSDDAADVIFTIGLLQQTITWYKIRHTGGQAHYYSRTGTLKQRDLNQSSVTGLCFNVPVRE